MSEQIVPSIHIQNYVLEMLFNCEPDCADILKPLLYEELEDINKHGPKEEDLDKVLTNICKDKKQTKPHNL